MEAMMAAFAGLKEDDGDEGRENRCPDDRVVLVLMTEIWGTFPAAG